MFKWLKRKDKRKFSDVEKIKNHTAETIEKVHVCTFFVFDALVYILFDRVVLSRVLSKYEILDTALGDVIGFIVFGVGYTVIFCIVKKIFNRCIAKNHPRFDIEGLWYHVHIPNRLGENSSVKEPISAGTVEVSRDLNDFTFSACNFKYTVKDGAVFQIQREKNTKWWTETSEICESNDFQIVEVYKASSEGKQTVKVEKCPVCGESFKEAREVEEATEYRYGIHLYDLNESKSKGKIVCKYSDCWPSRKSGNLFMYRSEAERDAKIMEYFQGN